MDPGVDFALQKECSLAIYGQPTRERAEAASFIWIDAIAAELYPTYPPVLLIVKEG